MNGFLIGKLWSNFHSCYEFVNIIDEKTENKQSPDCKQEESFVVKSKMQRVCLNIKRH